MKIFVLILTILATQLCLSSGQIGSAQIQQHSNSNDTIYIPVDLEDCFEQLDKIFADSSKEKIKAMTEGDFSAQMHLNFGMWMRNNWGLWKGSRLSKFFNEKGIYHPDDMSGIILDSYYRRLTGKDILLDQQVKYYQNYWKVVKQPSKIDFPKGVKNLEFNSGLYYDSKSNGQGFVHIGTSSKSSNIWLYDYYLGWAKVAKADIQKLEQNQDARETILIELYKRNKR